MFSLLLLHFKNDVNRRVNKAYTINGREGKSSLIIVYSSVKKMELPVQTIFNKKEKVVQNDDFVRLVRGIFYLPGSK
jgi:hypothetical protein